MAGLHFVAFDMLLAARFVQLLALAVVQWVEIPHVVCEFRTKAEIGNVCRRLVVEGGPVRKEEAGIGHQAV